MAAKSDVLIGLPDDDDGIASENCSVSQLVSALKSSFLASNWFSVMEEVLIRREEKLNKQNEMLKENKEVDRLEKMHLESEKQKFEEECLNLCQLNSKLLEENKTLRARRENAEERCKTVLQEMDKVGEADKSEILKLRKHNLELEMVKGKLEEEIELYKRRFVQLESMLSEVEEKCSNLTKLYEHSKKNMDSGIAARNEKKADRINGDHGANAEKSLHGANVFNEREVNLETVEDEQDFGNEIIEKGVCKKNDQAIRIKRFCENGGKERLLIDKTDCKSRDRLANAENSVHVENVCNEREVSLETLEDEQDYGNEIIDNGVCKKNDQAIEIKGFCESGGKKSFLIDKTDRTDRDQVPNAENSVHVENVCNEKGVNSEPVEDEQEFEKQIGEKNDQEFGIKGFCKNAEKKGNLGVEMSSAGTINEKKVFQNAVAVEGCQEWSDGAVGENRVSKINELRDDDTPRGNVGSFKDCGERRMCNVMVEKFEEDIGLAGCSSRRAGCSSRRADTWKARKANIVVISDSDDENSPIRISKRKRDSSPDIDAKKSRSTDSSNLIGNFSGRRIDSAQICSRSRENLPQMSQILFENLLGKVELESSSSDSD